MFNSIFPRELARKATRSLTLTTAAACPSTAALRSAFEMAFSMLAIDIRTLTPDC